MISGAGTTERSWLPFLDGLALRGLDLSAPPSYAVVVAPHPDDEVLGAGGLIALLSAAGTRVTVIAVTDGEASHPGGSTPPDVLARLRRAETRSALADLGTGIAIETLGLPDGGAEGLEQPVAAAVRTPEDGWLVGPFEGDGHPDHEAVGRACATAAARDGVRLLSYPVWAWHWAKPREDTVPWGDAVRVDLPPWVRAAKARAVGRFTSQTTAQGPLPQDAAVLPPAVLARFARPFEVLFA